MCNHENPFHKSGDGAGYARMTGNEKFEQVRQDTVRLQRMVTDPKVMTRRKAYDVVYRCTLTGCDWHARMWLADPMEAGDAMYRRLAYGEGSGQGRQRYGRAHYRVVSCQLSADQATRGVQ
jgi:hypothetical protein